MKSQFINLDKALAGITSMVIASVKDITLTRVPSAPKFSAEKLTSYVLPLVKQIFRDNFMGSDLEMGMMLIFLKSYVSSASRVLSGNAVTSLFKKVKVGKNAAALLRRNDFYIYKHAA